MRQKKLKVQNYGTSIKRVKKANMFCLSHEGKQYWFTTRQEASNKLKELKNEQPVQDI